MLTTLTILFLLADPNCVPVMYPVPALPFDIRQVLQGEERQWLAPFPGEPNRVEVQAGVWTRTEQLACDPDGDTFTVTCDDPAVTIVVQDGRWSFSVPVAYKEWKILKFTATDSPVDSEPMTAKYWTAVRGGPRPNRAPILR